MHSIESQLLMALVYAVILWKYNSLIPLACLLFTIEYLAGILIKPILGKSVHPDGQPPERIASYVFIPVGMILFWYSLPI